MSPTADDQHKKALLRERTTSRTLILAGVLVALAALLFWASDLCGHAHWFIRQAIIREIAAAIIATGLVAILWETYAKRALIAELQPDLAQLVGHVRLAQDVSTAGLMKVTTDFQHGIDWASLFNRVQDFDAFFAYARSWIGSNRTHLEQLAKRKGARVRFVYPDPENEVIMASLAHRFGESVEHVRQLITQSQEELKAIFAAGHCEFSILVSSFVPVFSFYRFDHIVVIAMYKHRPIRGGDVPAFVVTEGGAMHNFMINEFNVIFDEPDGARRIFPPSEESGKPHLLPAAHRTETT